MESEQIGKTLDNLFKFEAENLENEINNYLKNPSTKDMGYISQAILYIESKRNSLIQNIENYRTKSCKHSLCWKFEKQVYKLCSDKIVSLLGSEIKFD